MFIQPRISTNKATPASTLSSPERSPNPSTGLHRVKILPGIIQFLIRPFCVTRAANSTQLQAGPDYNRPGVWGLENKAENIAILLRPIV